MSSTYYLLCLGHNPATIISEIPNPGDRFVLDASTKRSHPGCDFVILESSGAPFRVGCPGVGDSPCKYHAGNIYWIELDWLRLLSFIEPDDPREEIQKVLRGNALRCWTTQRLARMRNELG